MLDSIEIFTTSGVVLWSRSYVPVKSSLVNDLIKQIFIEERSAAAVLGTDVSARKTPPYKQEQYTLKWTTVKDFGLIFVAVYQSLLHLTWIDTLLDNIRTLFVDLYKDRLLQPNDTVVADYPFDKYFDQQLKELEPSRDSESTHSSDNSSALFAVEKDSLEPPAVDIKPDYASISNGLSPEDAIVRSESPANHISTAKYNTPTRVSRRARKAAKRTPNASGDESRSRKPKEGKSGKKMRKWTAEGFAEDDDDDNTVLDYSAEHGDVAQVNGSRRRDNLDTVSAETWGERTKKGEFVLKDIDNEVHSILSQQDTSKNTGVVGSGIGALSNLFRGLVGGKTITENDLEKTIKDMEDHLVRRNVAPEAAKRLCGAVSQRLLGMKTSSFETINSAVHSAMEFALQKTLTPTTSLDLLHEIHSVNAQKQPYVISIVGVNGVGKSTSLSKLAFFLLQNHFRILIAACDTFRSGAVEQLRVHVNNLSSLCEREGLGDDAVSLYEKGYGKDAAHIARDAVAFATENSFDVVLVDTAGRRHNDVRLMSSLAKFAQLANPNKIFMVGEALVGNDSLAQARNFNAAFGVGRGLDGFIISKCDTVGEMVGTLVSMVMATGIPVVFLGVGQHYNDLRTLNVNWTTRLLMS